MKFSRLSKSQKAKVERALAIGLQHIPSAAVALGRGYEAVRQPFSNQRRPSVVELTGEDGILNANNRNRLTNMHRDMMRNSPTRVGQDQQLRVNVVGNVGGKLYANFPDGFEREARAVMDFINHEWAPHAEFTFGHNFNWILKTALTSMDSDGNVILVFDDGILSDGFGSGKIRAFEGDEIADLPAKDFARFFPASCKQSQGFVYDVLGRFCGCFVSSSQRGAREFDLSKGVLTLRRDPLFVEQPNWVCLGEERRFNQGRAVSSLSAAINTLVDLHEITASETQAAKINSQLVGQILKDAANESDADSPVGFDDETTDSSDDLPQTIEFSTRELSSIGARFDQMPEGMKIDLFDTKRPNANLEAYIEFLSGLCGGTRGLARVYSTLKAQTSYTAYRGEQCMTAPTFEERQKMLERDVCDPMIRLAIKWGITQGLLSRRLPDGWENMLSFTWPRMREVNEVDAQNALAQKLKNGVTTLHRELAPGEYEAILAERIREKADYDAAGLIYPGTETVSGALFDEAKDEDENDSDSEPVDEGADVETSKENENE